MVQLLTKTLLLACALQLFLPSTPILCAPWNSPPDISLAAAEDDPRIRLVYASIQFWNTTLNEIGSSFQLGKIYRRSLPDINETLKEMSAEKIKNSEDRLSFPSFMNDINTDFLIILTDVNIVSFTEYWEEKNKVLIAIKTDSTPPLSMPNVTRNVIAHELGHAIGLDHNSNAKMLMCGRPSACRPDAFSSPISHFLPLTEAERTYLRNMYETDTDK